MSGCITSSPFCSKTPGLYEAICTRVLYGIGDDGFRYGFLWTLRIELRVAVTVPYLIN